ncbi:ATP-binding protein [Mycoplasmopsis columbina SF7]|uniref:ATP-binding protein n=1 Tax=Mycoplasmopsis columbina SF7 TaxID=1037410 RepID=F9UJX9_9BACT|nr:DEAD/DEAH box helicase [Mycoplasmopsis columbina]EGV00325.1 ATP-binding protein [Mycoplasmopsis columbina SF7]
MNVKKEYQAILNNLLDVSPNDPAVFTNINSKFSYDFYRTFDLNLTAQIIKNPNFNVPLLEKNSLKIAEEIKEMNDPQLIINHLLENDFELSENRKGQIFKHLTSQKEKIVSELKAKFQKQITEWKLFENKAEEIYQQSSTWPMHLGFVFIKVSIEGKPIFAPLFLKEVDMEFKNGKAYLKAASEIKVNEKLLFILKQANFDLALSDEFSTMSIAQIVNHLNIEWDEIYNFKVDLVTECLKIKAEDIKNRELEFYGGLVLGLYQPSGGYARNRMLEIIQKNEVESIIEVEFNKNKYNDKIDKVIFNPKSSIFKITPTNYSQDRAIVSSLNQNTIIWGPPGTGKSQTIVNILTNILMYERNALVCSEKKAALDVIEERLGVLRTFTLTLVLSRNVKRKSFYEPISQYLEYLQQFKIKEKIKPQIPRIINQSEVEFIEKIQTWKDDTKLPLYAKFIEKYNDKWTLLSQDLWDKLLELDNTMLYTNNFDFKNSKEYLKALLKANKVKFKPFNLTNKKIKKLHQYLYENLKSLNPNLNDDLNYFTNLNSNDFEKINQLFNLLPEKNNLSINDENQLKDYIAYNIVQKIEKFTKEENDLLKNFIIAVNTAKMEPFKFVKQFAPIIKKIYPIIIATPDTDLSPWQKNEFDYAILDESSQIFLEKGLPILYLAKKKILAGDDQQMKPSNWFGIRYTDEETIYGTVESLLDYAKSLGVHTVLLDKNYRSNFAALMTFSSKFFYNESLDVIDSSNNPHNFKPIEVYDINGIWENNTNLSEVALAIEKLKENLPIYKKVILLCFNKKQQEFIQNEIINSHKDLEEYLTTGNLLIRNIENIQGDEADLIIATVGYDANAAIHSTYVGRSGGKNALNVAISRAKDKMIVIKSLKSNDIVLSSFENEDVYTFKKWLEFLELSEEEKKSYLTKVNREKNYTSNENPLFIDINNTLNKLAEENSNLKVLANESVGTINVDLVLSYKNRHELCFIIDDFSYASNINEYLKFKDKIKFIKSKKYKVFWVNYLTWFKQKTEILEYVTNLSQEKTQEIEELTRELDLDNSSNKNENTYFALENEKEIEREKRMLNLPVVVQNKSLDQVDNLELMNNELFIETKIEEETIEIPQLKEEN